MTRDLAFSLLALDRFNAVLRYNLLFRKSFSEVEHLDAFFEAHYNPVTEHI